MPMSTARVPYKMLTVTSMGMGIVGQGVREDAKGAGNEIYMSGVDKAEISAAVQGPGRKKRNLFRVIIFFTMFR